MGWVRRSRLDAQVAAADRITELLLRAEGHGARAVVRAERAEAECVVLAARVRQLFAAQDVITGVASSLASVAGVDAEQANA